MKANTEFQVEGLYNRHTGKFSFTVTDSSSSTPIINLELTAVEWLNLSTGSIVNMKGWITPNLDRVGKVMKHRTLDVPREVLEQLPYQGSARRDEARAWGEIQSEPGEHVETRSTNTGWRVILRRYEEA